MLSAYLGLILFILLLWLIDSYSGLPGCKAVAFVAIVLFSGLRYDVGVDYLSYEHYYYDYHAYEMTVEPVWTWLAEILNKIGFAPRGWFLLTSLVINGCVFYGIRKMSPDFFLSVISYMVIVTCFWESLNAVRQFAAIGILFAGSHFLLQNRKLIFTLYIIVAAQFHFSALIMLPIMFFLRMKIPRWGLVAILAASWLGHEVIQRWGIFSVLANISEYSGYVNKVFDDGVTTGLLQYFYLLVGAVIILVSKRVEENFEHGGIFINAAIFGIATYLVFFDFLVLMRLMWFFSIYFIILIPAIKVSIRRNNRIILIPSVLLCFAIFLFKTISDLPYQFDFILFE